MGLRGRWRTVEVGGVGDDDGAGGSDFVEAAEALGSHVAISL